MKKYHGKNSSSPKYKKEQENIQLSVADNILNVFVVDYKKIICFFAKS